MTTFNEADCLKTNPFEGDFGSPGDTVLKDKIGTARKGGTCGMCQQEIVPGERVRLLAAVFDGTLMSYRWCSECCAAMAESWTDDGRAWESRVRLGDESSLASGLMDGLAVRPMKARQNDKGNDHEQGKEASEETRPPPRGLQPHDFAAEDRRRAPRSQRLP